MKTKEFIKRVEDLGYTRFSTNERFIQICDHRGRTLAEVSREKLYHINTNKDEPITKTLFDLIVEYTSTPVEDREEEEKFLIQHKYLVSKNLLPVNLVWNKLKDVYRSINLKVDNHIYQAQFTLKEVEDIKIKLNTDLADFELVEVKDEN